jgi:FKBP12-rapamycin complex-associated protein
MDRLWHLPERTPTKIALAEKIPFRLTRMLIKAMEASQIEGNFRTTCENVMRVMRTNKESLMAVLEAFVHDPLLNWRLLGREAPSDQEVEGQETSGSSDVDLRPEAPLTRKQQQFSSSKMNSSFDIAQVEQVPEVLNEKAVEVITRVQQKLTGTDFTNSKLTVEEQVAKLIDQATSSENLSQGYFGWCPFW